MITSTEVREIALNNRNFDHTLITDSMIDVSIERHLVPLLGRELYEAVDSYSYLKDKARRALAFLVIFDHFPILQHRLTSIGVQKLTQRDGQVVDAQDRMYTADYFRQMANVYLDLITTQLEDYPNEYPEYNAIARVSGYGTGIIM